MHRSSSSQNPMHVMSLNRKRESKSLEFIYWVSDFKFKWYTNLLLILFYISYLLFGTQMLIELTKSIELDQEQQSDNLITIRKENLRNDILFFNFYKNIYINENIKHNDLANSSSGELVNNNSILNRKRNNKNNYLAYNTYKRDKAFRSKLDRELDELIEQVNLKCQQIEYKKLKNFNESFLFIIKLLTTLGIEEKVKLLLINGDLYTKLFIIIYSLIGLPFSFLLVFYYSRFLTYLLSKLVCLVRKSRRSKDQKKKRKEISSSLLNEIDSNLDQNLQFVITNRSSIILPNMCINLNNLNKKYSLNELNNLDLNNVQHNSISYNELNHLQHNHIGSNTSNSFNSFNNLNFDSYANQTYQSNGTNRIDRTNRFKTTDKINTIRQNRSNFLNTPNRFSDFNVSCEFNTDSNFNNYFNGNPDSNRDLPEPSTLSNLTITNFTSSQPMLNKSSLSINGKPNRNSKFSSTISRTDSTATINPIRPKAPTDLEENIPIILPLFIVCIHLFISTLLIHQTGKLIILVLIYMPFNLNIQSFLLENSSLFDSFFLVYLSFTLNGIGDYLPESAYFFWLQCVLVFANLILLFTFVNLVCIKILNYKK